MKIKPFFAWYDLWVGAFWDRAKRRLYILPLPMLGVVIQLPLRPRGLADHGTYEQAVEWVLDVFDDDPFEVGTFLRAWRMGDLNEWPEFYTWLAAQRR